MASNKQLGSRTSKLVDTTSVPGARFDAGPYIGVVKNNIDPNRSGRLQVFIPDLGGIATNPTHWRTVHYASPFFGMTTYPANRTQTENSWKKVSHTYGMWFTPPDLDNLVLVTFAMGNPSRGYWFACVNPTLSHNMVPGISGMSHIDKTQLSPDLAPYLTGERYPVTEFNENNKALWNQRSDYVNIDKPIHEAQVRILLEQGLEDDLVRGVISSSCQRESPSYVFGISTPGRDTDNVNDLDPKTKAPMYRLGGHQFLMDDGDVKGIDQLIRLRTAGGHQFLMNDSEEIVYFANNNGTVWMEFTGDGQFHVYSKGGFNLRSEGSINLHADQDINMYAGNNINAYAKSTITEQAQTINIKGTSKLLQYGGQVGIGSGSQLKLSAASQGSFNGGGNLIFSGGQIHLNTKDAPTVSPPDNLTIQSFTDVVQVGLKWEANGEVLSTVETVPTHEPWISEHNIRNTAPTPTSTQPSLAADPVTKKPGPASAIGKGVSSPAPVDIMSTQPPATVAVANLTRTQTDAVKAQIGNAINASYTAVSVVDGALGKYQTQAQTLIDQGFVNSGLSNVDLSVAASWQDEAGNALSAGISSADDFLASVDIQELVMDQNLVNISASLTANGLIAEISSPINVGGLLTVAHNLGVDAAVAWVSTGIDVAASATELFNQGRYAISVLAESPELSIEADLVNGSAVISGGLVTSVAELTNIAGQVSNEVTQISATISSDKVLPEDRLPRPPYF